MRQCSLLRAMTVWIDRPGRLDTNIESKGVSRQSLELRNDWMSLALEETKRDWNDVD
jgi:hypothetical protein